MVQRSYKLKPDKQDLRDKVFYASTLNLTSQLPATVDLRKYLSPVVDQGDLGSCTANAIASGLGEYLQKVSKKQFTPLSRLELYWWERFLEGNVNQDSGAEIRDGMKIFNQLGISPEKDYPYDIAAFTNQPSPQAIIDASVFKISSYHRVQNLNYLKTSLAEGLPVVTGILVYESFESKTVARNGVVPMPDPKKEQLLGGHAVLAVGYIDKKQQVIMRNSWSTKWGDRGYFYLPYDYFTDPNGYVMDMWTGQ
ncbi:C1 family peptidase [Clostridium sp.]|uniref:C1 family peptidase n=1 Tax=Clostridium sp. TaxID=1506 RepID=UPI0026103427|nr:C1 family peptidase [Clostridium sp.]